MCCEQLGCGAAAEQWPAAIKRLPVIQPHCCAVDHAVTVSRLLLGVHLTAHLVSPFLSRFRTSGSAARLPHI